MPRFSASFAEIFISVWRHRDLVRALIRREVIGRYRGSFLGILWSFLHPVFMLCVYTFVFGVIFKARWNIADDSKAEFAIVLFAGLMVFNLFSECVNRAPRIILENANYVKKVIFPLEILPWVTLGAAFFHMMVSFSVWLIFHFLLIGMPHATIFLLPLVLLPVVLLTMGCCWVLAAVGVYLRDLGQLVGMGTTVLMFLSPIFYPVSALPASYQPLLLLNPLAPAIEQVREILIWGRQPDWSLYGVYLFAGMLAFWLGFACFQKTRKGFADVL